jgi:Chromate transporter
VQPDDGIDPVLRLVAAATKSLWIKQFTLREPRLVQAIIDAHHCGVAVRVMLNPHRSSDIQHPKFVDATIVERMVAAQERGVRVRVLCGGRHGLSIVSLVGLRAASWSGALVAAVAMFIPPVLLTFAASQAWEHFRTAKWRMAAEKGLAPITVGLLLASGLVITRAADHGWSAIALTAASTILLVATRVNPLFIMVGAGILGGLGLVQ